MQTCSGERRERFLWRLGAAEAKSSTVSLESASAAAFAMKSDSGEIPTVMIIELERSEEY